MLIFERLPKVTPNLLATWCFAAGVLLPASLAALVVVISVAAEWPAGQIARKRVPHRYLYSGAEAVLAAIAAGRVAQLPIPYFAAVLLAALAYLVIGAVAVALAVCAAGQYGSLKQCLLPRTYQLEVLTITIALGEIALSAFHIPLLWLSLPVTVALQRRFTRDALRQQDDSGLPMSETVWVHVAREVVHASEVVSILRIDTADPAAAASIARLQAGCDAIGRFADRNGLAILLTDCPGANADALARRLRTALERQSVPCNVAVAAKPRDGRNLNDLLAVTEAELVMREASARTADSASPDPLS